jgi:Reverse transcriptase (RNA-dependent DNA polymerase)
VRSSGRCLSTYHTSRAASTYYGSRPMHPPMLSHYRPNPTLTTKADASTHVIPSRPIQAFVQGKKIAKKNLLAGQTLSFLHKNKIPSVPLKIDFRKAFDTISWDCLIALLRARQFPNQWISWIHNLLISSSSVIHTNGHEGTVFFHG